MIEPILEVGINSREFMLRLGRWLRCWWLWQGLFLAISRDIIIINRPRKIYMRPIRKGNTCSRAQSHDECGVWEYRLLQIYNTTLCDRFHFIGYDSGNVNLKPGQNVPKKSGTVH
ncbi:hypothetical protein TSUD_283710 [Trifolium subterraneum]|uniref:Uncharacterized protein n=1 Tax=Trifolium subterraneum TaxID=3900 RepID=A0A2Z6PD63_TRISU|nr:hypothetical protein TSUD_283710 [Trifolium subterraneum]